MTFRRLYATLEGVCRDFVLSRVSNDMKVLIACELYGRVRDAFIARGHEAYSCDEYWSNGNHIHGNVLDVLDQGWDLMIAFPPCTHLCSSGAHKFHEKRSNGKQKEALDFVNKLLAAPIKKIAIENPVGIIATHIRKCDQLIEPWMFGHGVTKGTCLWLKNLPKLKPTNIVPGRFPEAHYVPGTKRQARLRGMTYPGIAKAMAEQWG